MHLLSTFRNGSCSDLNIIVDGKVFPTHKLIWMASSKWFQQKIPALKPEEPITLNSFPGGIENFSDILDYLYNHQDINHDLSTENCVPLLLGTHYLLLKDLKETILTFLRTTFTDNLSTLSDGEPLQKLMELNKMITELKSYEGKTAERVVTNLHNTFASLYVEVLDVVLQTSNTKDSLGLNDEVAALLRDCGTSFSLIVSSASCSNKHGHLLEKIFLHYLNAESCEETNYCLKTTLLVLPAISLKKNITPDSAKKLALMATGSALRTLIEVALSNVDFTLVDDKSANDLMDFIESFDAEKPFVISIILDILLKESNQSLSTREKIFRMIAEFHKTLENHNKLYLLLEKLLGQISTESRVKNQHCLEMMCLVDMRKLDPVCLKLLVESPSSPFADFKDGRFSPFLQVAEAAIELCLQKISNETQETAGPSPKRPRYKLLDRGMGTNIMESSATLSLVSPPDGNPVL